MGSLAVEIARCTRNLSCLLFRGKSRAGFSNAEDRGDVLGRGGCDGSSSSEKLASFPDFSCY